MGAREDHLALLGVAPALSDRPVVRDAIELVLDERRARGEPIPEKGFALVEPIEVVT
jgi:hypothetical protein